MASRRGGFNLPYLGGKKHCFIGFDEQQQSVSEF